MNYAVTCMVGIMVFVHGRAQHLNIELRGTEVRERSSDSSLIDFSTDLRLKHIKPLGPQAFYVNTNSCIYSTPPDVVNLSRIARAERKGL